MHVWMYGAAQTRLSDEEATEQASLDLALKVKQAENTHIIQTSAPTACICCF